MANYKEQPLNGTKWQRAHRVEINNPPGTLQKSITFHEVVHSELGDGTSVDTAAGSITEPFVDPNVTFPLRNPTDDSVIDGQFATYGQVHVLLHSLYLFLAERRDAQQQP